MQRTHTAVSYTHLDVYKRQIEMYADAIGVTASDVTQIMSDGELSAMDFINTMNLAMTTRCV